MIFRSFIFILFFYMVITIGLYASDPETYLNAGEKYFEEALELALKDEGKSKEYYRKSAQNYELYLVNSPNRNGKIFYNLGNAYFFADEYGLALLNYRKAELFMPYDSKLQQNINQVKAHRYDDMSTGLFQRLDMIFIWHYRVSTSIRMGVLALFLLVFWGLIFHQLYKRRRHTFSIVISGILALVMIASVAIDLFDFNKQSHGVIIQQEVTARKGNSYVYEPAFDSNLHGGTEFTVIEKRGEWFLVELENNEPCWLPENALGIVDVD